MQTICMLSRYSFASGAEEKIVRTFQAPANFVQNMRRICNVTEDIEGDAVIECKKIFCFSFKINFYSYLFLNLFHC